jgi:hypothetical protein
LARLRAFGTDLCARQEGVAPGVPPAGWVSVKSPDSLKALRDSAGNIQFILAEKTAQELLADVDLDDHAGLEHVADVTNVLTFL